jgi:hypothetical protein
MGLGSMGKKKKTINSNASPSAYGWCFQVGAGISLMLDNVQHFTHLKMEGKSDDIELSLEGGNKLYAQAKSVIKMGDQRSAGKNLTNALKVLSKDEQNGDAIKLVYITNIANPLSSKLASAFRYDYSYDFSFLSSDDKKKITEIVGQDFPTDKFQLKIINFFGQGKDKFQRIKEKIEEFLLSSGVEISYSSLLLDNWFTTFMLNAADKPDIEQKIDLPKSKVIFPIIAVIIDPPISDTEFGRVCDYENYSEVRKEFTNIINENTYDHEFIMKVLGDYVGKRNMIEIMQDRSDYKYEYTKNEWQNYEKDFINIANIKIREALIKILLLTIITRNDIINRIKKAVNL